MPTHLAKPLATIYKLHLMILLYISPFKKTTSTAQNSMALQKFPLALPMMSQKGLGVLQVANFGGCSFVTEPSVNHHPVFSSPLN